MRTLHRSPEMWAKYQSRQLKLYGSCGLCKDLIGGRPFLGWKLINNEYGYDATTSRHDILVAPKHKAVSDLLLFWRAYRAYRKLKKTGQYDCIRINFPSAQSVPAHSHIHLIKDKRVV